MASKKVSVVLVADESYAAFAAVACLTLLESCPEPSTLVLHLLHHGLDVATLGRLKRTVELGRGQLISYDVKLHAAADPRYRNRSPHYYRLMAPELLPSDVERFLYIDCDLLVYQDIRQLATRDLGAATVAACRDYLGHVGDAIANHKNLGLDPEAPFFNSGVMVVQRNLWNLQKVSNRVLECTDDNRSFLDAQGKFHQYDQYALNVVLYGRWLLLSEVWNYGAERPYRKAAVVHFNGHGKPWGQSCTMIYRRDFYAALERAGWGIDDLPAESRQVNLERKE